MASSTVSTRMTLFPRRTTMTSTSHSAPNLSLAGDDVPLQIGTASPATSSASILPEFRPHAKHSPRLVPAPLSRPDSPSRPSLDVHVSLVHPSVPSSIHPVSFPKSVAAKLASVFGQRSATAYRPLSGVVDADAATAGLPPPARSRRKWKVILAFAAPIIISSIVMYHYRAEIMQQSARFADFVRGHKVVGPLLLTMAIFTTMFPPIMGLSTILYLCGYIYGFPGGFAPAYLGALGGACTCFLLTHSYLRGYASRALARYPSARALRHTIDKRGLKLLILIRLAPYPSNMVNVLLATSSSISLRTFALASALTFPKYLLQIYIGSSLSTFADLVSGTHSPESHALSLAVVGCSIALGIGLTVWLWFHVQRIVKEDALDMDEEDAEAGHIRMALMQEGTTAAAATSSIDAARWRHSSPSPLTIVA
ncbi:hypothetical protein GGF31_008263 [Allomyces arbusculus]|nr:hypothetical protein GGF31_008263 [Allomyces arbusculus]